MFGKKENKKLTEEERDVLSAVYSLVFEGKIAFSELKPLVKDHSGIIENEIKEREEEEHQRQLLHLKNDIKKRKEKIDYNKQILDKHASSISEMHAELEYQKGKKGYERDEARIQNLLWWIFSEEENVEELKSELTKSEAELKTLEDDFLKEETTK